jgi:hypothetical protein
LSQVADIPVEQYRQIGNRQHTPLGIRFLGTPNQCTREHVGGLDVVAQVSDVFLIGHPGP